MSYVGNPGYVFGGSIVDNILYGVKYRPVRMPDRPPEELKAFEREHKEALNSGNSPEPLEADWVDDGDIGVNEPEGRLDALVRVLGLVLFADDVYLLGLRGTALISGAIGAGATRTSASSIEQYLFDLLP